MSHELYLDYVEFYLSHVLGNFLICSRQGSVCAMVRNQFQSRCTIWTTCSINYLRVSKMTFKMYTESVVLSWPNCKTKLKLCPSLPSSAIPATDEVDEGVMDATGSDLTSALFFPSPPTEGRVTSKVWSPTQFHSIQFYLFTIKHY